MAPEPDLLPKVTEAFLGDSHCLQHCSHVTVPCESPGGAEGPTTHHKPCTAQPNPELWAEEGLRHPTAHPRIRPLIYSQGEGLSARKNLWGLVFCHFFPKLLCHSPTVGLKHDDRRIWLFSCCCPKQSYLRNTCSLLCAFPFLLFHPFQHQKSFPIIFFPVDFLFSGSEWVLPPFPMLSLSFNQSHFLISHLITQVLPGPQPPSELASAGAALTK